MRLPYLSALLVTTTIALLGCTKEWKNPATGFPVMDVDVAMLLTTPTFYDGAGVRVKGKVWNVERGTFKTDEGVEAPYTRFVVADREGNSLGVFAKGEIEVKEGDMVRVAGYFRLWEETPYHNFRNEIEAVRVEVLGRR